MKQFRITYQLKSIFHQDQHKVFWMEAADNDDAKETFRKFMPMASIIDIRQLTHPTAPLNSMEDEGSDLEKQTYVNIKMGIDAIHNQTKRRANSPGRKIPRR